MNRRDLLKYFGIGASVIPIVGGMPVPGAEAKLIAVPRVEPVALAENHPANDQLWKLLESKSEMLCYFRTPDGHTWTFEASAFVMRLETKWSDLAGFGRYYPSALPDRSECVWRLEGVLNR